MRLFCRLFFADSLLLLNGLNLIQFRLNGCLFFLDIVIVLQSQPESRRCPEVLPESQCRICGDATTSSDYFRYSCLRYPGFFRETVRTNAAMVENMDTNVGRVLAALDDHGCAQNTLVVLTSDNGGLATSEAPVTSNLPLAEGKGWTYEGGVRVPQIVRMPGVVPVGSQCSEPTTSCDWFPTLLELAGLPQMPDRHADGMSIAPLLRSETMQRGPIFWHYPHYSNQGSRPACAVRNGEWKLIEHFEDGRKELFNLREDPGEAVDLAAREPDRVDELAGRLLAWRADVEALVPRPDPNWVAPSSAPRTRNRRAT